MPEKQVNVKTAMRSMLGLILRLAFVAALVIWAAPAILNFVEERGSTDGVAGFRQGVVNGALMPLALPSLFLGQDVAIYAANNNGRIYNLGYTLGVNGCGALFFGLLFWRLARWRKSARAAQKNGFPT